MKTKEVLLLLTENWADWEVSHAISGINPVDDYVVKTIAVDQLPKASIGGLRTEVDYTIEDYDNFDHLAMVILAGGFSWNETHNDIADFLKKIVNQGIPVSAICGTTLFLARHGFLNQVKHTGDSWEYFEEHLKDEAGYTGKENFVSAQVVVDNGFITANETASVEFAYEIFKVLKLFDDEDLAMWYDYFKNGMFR